MSVKSYLNRFQRDEEGATSIVYAIILPVMVGLGALAFEAGHFQQRNARIQSAVDMAAMAAALEFQITNDRDKARLAGKGDAYENGYIPEGGKVEVETPITSGPHAGSEGAIVRITQAQERYFSQIIPGREEIFHTVEATVIAASGGSPICVLSLNDSDRRAIEITGNTDVNLDSCAIHTNSSSDGAFRMGGSGSLTANCISAVGTADIANSGDNLECSEPKDNAAAIVDPYADVNVDPAVVASLPCKPNVPMINQNRTVTLGPGRYCNGQITIAGILNLDPGVYYFDNTEVKFNGNRAVLNAAPPDGVSLVFLNNGELTNTNGGDIKIKAQSDGPFPGIALYGDPVTSNPHRDIKINGNQETSIEGAIYFPVQNIEFTGGSDLNSSCTQIIANKIKFTGNAGLTVENCAPLGTSGISGSGSAVGVRLVN